MISPTPLGTFAAPPVTSTAAKYRWGRGKIIFPAFFSSLPRRDVPGVDEAVVRAEAVALDRLEAEPLVEAMRSCVGGERVDQDRLDGGIGEAAFEREAHHGGAVALVQGVRLADPDVDGAEIGLDLAPVVRLLAGRVDDLHEADRPPSNSAIRSSRQSGRGEAPRPTRNHHRRRRRR
jgi:hypothetical protein